MYVACNDLKPVQITNSHMTVRSAARFFTTVNVTK